MKVISISIVALFLIGCCPAAFEANDINRDGDNVEVEHVTLESNSCQQIGDNLWAQNINSGSVFDVYYNDECKDSLGEHCDNVVPSEAATGRVGQYHGSGTVCWVEDIQISGTSLENGDIEVHLVYFGGM